MEVDGIFVSQARVKAPAKTQWLSRIVLSNLLPDEEDDAVRPFLCAAVDHPGLDLVRHHRLPNPANPATDEEARVVEAVAVNAEEVAVNAEELPAGYGVGLEAAMSECGR